MVNVYDKLVVLSAPACGPCATLWC